MVRRLRTGDAAAIPGRSYQDGARGQSGPAETHGDTHKLRGTETAAILGFLVPPSHFPLTPLFPQLLNLSISHLQT